MRSIDYEITREFVVQHDKELHSVLSCTGSLLPEVCDRINFAHLENAASVYALFKTTEFAVLSVVLLPGFGEQPGKLPKRGTHAWLPDTLRVLLQPVFGAPFSPLVTICLGVRQEEPQEEVKSEAESPVWSDKDRIDYYLVVGREKGIQEKIWRADHPQILVPLP